ncbi:MAG: DUF2844 domain-containing protein [Steroidobacteraceae bacterium]
MATRSIRLIERLVLCAAVLAVAVLPAQARAALGEPAASASRDADELHGAIKSTQRSSYRVHEIRLPSGTILREFSTLDGPVFAVAWNGPAMPNLRQALGRYFDDYVRAAESNHGRRHFQMQNDRFVMQSSGRMRAFSGRAFLPGAIPAGVTVDELQ